MSLDIAITLFETVHQQLAPIPIIDISVDSLAVARSRGLTHIKQAIIVCLPVQKLPC